MSSIHKQQTSLKSLILSLFPIDPSLFSDDITNKYLTEIEAIISKLELDSFESFRHSDSFSIEVTNTLRLRVNETIVDILRQFKERRNNNFLSVSESTPNNWWPDPNHLYIGSPERLNQQLVVHKHISDCYNSILEQNISSHLINQKISNVKKKDEYMIVIIHLQLVQEIVTEIITLLTSFENLLISKWFEKSTIIQTEFIISLGKIYDWIGKEFTTSILTTIEANDRQISEWVNFFGKSSTEVKEILSKTDFFDGPWKHLAIDTCYFDDDFKEKILKSLSEYNLQDLLDGYTIKSDNWHALQSLKPMWQRKIKCIYLDPPYNTGNIDFSYEDNMSRSSWMIMMRNRLELAKCFLTEDGVILISISDNELYNLKILLEEIFGDNFLGAIITQTNPRGRTLDKHLAKTHEYLLIYALDKTSETALFKIPKNASQLAEYNKVDEDGQSYRLIELRNRNPRFNRNNRPNLFYPIYANPKTMTVSLTDSSEYTVEILPKTSHGEDDCWTWGKEKTAENIELLSAKKVSTGAWRVFRRAYLSQNGASTTNEKSIWLDKSLSNERGKEQLRELFGYHAHGLGYPKSVDYIERIIQLATTNNQVVMDFFAGSGTTAHAVMISNKKRQENRKFLLVERSPQFESVILPRIKKLSYSYQWKDGVPIKTNGQGVFIQYLILEQPWDRLINVSN